MSIVTKKGDKGKTSLYRGPAVSKDDMRIEACGILDELISFLGLSRSVVKDRKLKDIIKRIQEELFLMGTEFATGARLVSKIKNRISSGSVKYLENKIKSLEKQNIIKSRSFTLCGNNFTAASLDVARTIARKLERRVVTLKKKNMLRSKFILVYLNRLSDLLYLLARDCEKKHFRLKV